MFRLFVVYAAVKANTAQEVGSTGARQSAGGWDNSFFDQFILKICAAHHLRSQNSGRRYMIANDRMFEVAC